MSELKEILDMASDIEPSHAAMQELILIAFKAGKDKQINRQSDELKQFKDAKNWTRSYGHKGDLLPGHALYRPYLKSNEEG